MAAATGAATSRVAEAMGVSSQTNPAAVVGKVVEDHFKPLIEAAGKPLDMVLGLLSAMYEQVAKVASTAPGSAPLQAAVGLDASQRLLDEAKIAPEPLSRWLTVAAQSSSSVRAGGTRAAVAAAAAQQLAPFCSGVETRFPFSQDPGAADMPMNDFVRLFGPGGAFEQFFAQNLRDFVDTSKRVWQPVSMAGGQSPISSSDVAQFQRAAVIRNAFFPAALPGQAAASLRFELVPLALDPGARSATLEADGVKTPLAASSMPGRAVALTWPARSAVILSFDGDEQAPPLANDGPWAALRFVARSRLQPTSVPDKLRLTMQSGSRAAEFELRTNSIVHPFGLRELADFRCPRLGP
jgi:type VI secretion system protein ImpL